ncbi:ATP synthase F1 subunit gamma [Parablautia sp. Marseille-Q6255]|uniref:ATP synthase F1 subunit gamma n=1 Tax=Parablautia sp. Marseille-Q6255 TaxID=3039593 RepID=UPI0024BCC8CD|nr:ATP synthase F1 subunit gamma [Parablautia sp. Marseille-Q6255]
MANTREIQSRMKSIRDTMKITNAMYMISSTKLRRARRELEETEPYFYTLQSMLSRIIRHVPKMEHLYFGDGKTAQAKKKGFLVVTGDKGMAGAYNHNVLKLAKEQIESCDKYALAVVGEVGRQYFHSQKIEVDDHFLYTAQNPTMHRAREIAAKALALYETHEVEEVWMIFTMMVNAVQTQTKMMRLLPLSKEDFKTPEIPVNVYQEEFRFEPSPEQVLDHVVPNYVSGYIYGALMESYCSEHNARMTAMQAANDSAQAMIRELSIEYNRVRQAAITQEITEVVSGAKAQKRKRKKKAKGAAV